MSKSTMSVRPPAPQSAQDFIAAAEVPKVTTPDLVTPTLYPWEAPGVRDDVEKMVNIRLPEAYRLKLKYIGENQPKSQHQFLLDVVIPAIDAELRRQGIPTERI